MVGKEGVTFDDLKRLRMTQWVNDEIVNTWREILIQRFESTEDFSFWVATSYFYKKLHSWYQQKDSPAKSQEFERLRKFYRKQVNQIANLLLLLANLEIDQYS